MFLPYTRKNRADLKWEFHQIHKGALAPLSGVSIGAAPVQGHDGLEDPVAEHPEVTTPSISKVSEMVQELRGEQGELRGTIAEIEKASKVPLDAVAEVTLS